MVAVNGWELFAHPLFLDQLEKLTAAVGRARKKDPRDWRRSANAKLLAALHKLTFQTIPEDPARSEYRQGGTLGEDRKHWFRAKFGGGNPPDDWAALLEAASSKEARLRTEAAEPAAGGDNDGQQGRATRFSWRRTMRK
jgi:hypothetical protein